MPLLDRPHLVVELVVDVTFCDGAHPEGQGISHPCRRNGTAVAVIPPADDLPGWPPAAGDEEAQMAVIDRQSEAIVSRLSALLADIPGIAGGMVIDMRDYDA